MTPDKALELVGKYARLTKQIKSLTLEIGTSLDRCKGIDGKRLEMDQWGCHIHQRDTDNKNRDKSTHLWGWYQPEQNPDTDYGLEWHDVTLGDHGAECCHCYTAHLAIQLRKQARKDLGIVKGTMSRAIINKD